MRSGMQGRGGAVTAKGTVCVKTLTKEQEAQYGWKEMSKGRGWRGSQGPDHTESRNDLCFSVL